jgi:multidrug efflux system membrane fusion protein
MTGIVKAVLGRRYMFAAACIVLAVGVIVLYGRNHHSSHAAALPRVPVVAAAAQKKDFPIELTGLGNVTALNTATITSQVTGLISSVNFREGQIVKKGDVLARIDPRTFQAQLDEAIGTLGRDESHLANAQVNLNRYQELAHQNAIAQQMLSNQQSAVAEQKNDVVMDNAAIALARTNLSYTSLVAPFDGVAGIRLLDVGNVIQPTNTKGLVVITEIQPISVLFTLTSTDIPRVVSALAQGPVAAEAFSQDDKTLLDTGKLIAVNNQANPTSGTVQLKAIFPNARRQLWPGTFVNIHLVIGVRRGGITVPLDAIEQGPNGQFVFLVTRKRTVAVRPVHVDATQSAVALIGSGLKAGERVVVRGQYGLLPGAAVTEVPSRLASTVPNSSTATSGLLP